jgi:hypothetical protein
MSIHICRGVSCVVGGSGYTFSKRGPSVENRLSWERLALVSRSRRNFFHRIPAEKPPNVLFPTTLWHGKIIGNGLAPQAFPAALYALLEPTISASSPYVLLSPEGIRLIAAHILFLKGVIPSRSNGPVNPWLPHEKYCFIRRMISRTSSAFFPWRNVVDLHPNLTLRDGGVRGNTILLTPRLLTYIFHIPNVDGMRYIRNSLSVKIIFLKIFIIVEIATPHSAGLAMTIFVDTHGQARRLPGTGKINVGRPTGLTFSLAMTIFADTHPLFHRGGAFYSGFPARHAWCQAWQAGTPARPSDAEHLQDAKYGAACPGLSGESRYQKAHSSPGKPGVLWAPRYKSKTGALPENRCKGSILVGSHGKKCLPNKDDMPATTNWLSARKSPRSLPDAGRRW